MPRAVAHVSLVGALAVLLNCGSQPSSSTSPSSPTNPSVVAATITSISPTTLTASANAQTISVTGTNFATGLTLTLTPTGGASTTVSGQSITNLTSTSLQASVIVATAGTYSVQATNQGASASNAVSLDVKSATPVASPAPTITSIIPTTLVASAAPQVLTVRGTNFQPGLAVGYALGGGSTSVASGSQITNVTSTSFDATLTILQGGTYTFTVTNPDASVSNGLVAVVASPATQTATLFTVSPDPIVARPTPQTVSVSGKNFAPGLTMVATSDGGVTVTASGSQIANLTPQTFNATITISTAGQYAIQVVNPGAPPSNSLVQNIGGAGSPACAAAAPPPYVGNVNGLPVPQVVFSEDATHVGFYATIFENRTPSTLCGGGLTGPCPWVDACVVGGSCQGPVQVLCGCISGGLEVHFTRTADSGSCSATLAVHDTCGVTGSSTLTFALPSVPPLHPTLAAVSPTAFTAGNANQTVTVIGTDFLAPVTLSVAAAGYGSFLYSGAAISNLTPTSFQAQVSFPVTGTYTLQVRAAGGASNTISVVVSGLPPTPMSALLQLFDSLRPTGPRHRQ